MRFQLTTVVWGDWYVQRFLKANIPSLMAPGNLPALLEKGEGQYTIYTTPTDEATIRASVEFQALSRAIHCRVIRMGSETRSENPHVLHARLWWEDAQRARSRRAWVCFISPDTLWSDGAIGHVGNALLEGRTVAYGFPIRVIDETVCAELRTLGYGQGTELAIPARKLMDIGVRHLSPLYACYSRHAQRFGFHPEYLVYPVRGSGILLRAITAHCFAVDPAAVELNEHLSPRNKLRPDQVAFLTDSDAFCGLSFTKLLHQANWYAARKSHDLVETAVDWEHHFNPTMLELWKHSFYFRSGAPSPDVDRNVRAADVRELFAYLTWRAVRLHHLLRKRGFTAAAGLLAMAIDVARLHRHWREKAGITVLVPANAPLAAVGHKLRGLTAVGSEGRLRAFLFDHAIRGALPPEGDAQSGHVIALSGRKLRWRRSGDVLEIEGFRVGAPLAVDGEDDGLVAVHPISGVLGDDGV